MENNQPELIYEKERLEKTISLAKKQLCQARQENEENKSAIILAKQDMRENASHSISNLWGSEGFEALVELSQYGNRVTDKIADYEAVENKIAMLQKLIKSPYFARIDFKFDGENSFEEIYIGRSSLKEDQTNDFYVYDWRSPIAGVFYRFVLGPAFYDAPAGRISGEVNLKRQYEINDGKLEYYFDADVQIIDKFLRKLLSQNTSSKMKAIVETIQKEQDMVIRDMENDLMMVQGVAGSGKTSIALHRAAYLMYQGLTAKLTSEDILIISPNALFEQYISNVLPELGEEHVTSVVFEDILKLLVKGKRIQPRNRFLENLISSSRYKDIMKCSIEFKTSKLFLTVLNKFIEDLPHRWIHFKDVYYKGFRVMKKEELKKKTLSGLNETPLGQRLKLMEQYILEIIKESQRGRLKKSERIQIREVLEFLKVDIEAVYRQLFHDKEYFYELSRDIKLPDCIDDILTYTQENLDGSLLHYDDAIVLAYLNLKINGSNKYKNIKQVVIDEAQDYYPLHFEIFNLLFPRTRFTVVGDINQTLEKSEDLSLYEQIRNILKKKNSSLVTMDKSFRCTNEILNYSTRFLGHSSEIKSFNRKGDQPQVYAINEQSSFNDKVIAEVKLCREMGYQSIGLICKTEKNARALFKSLKGKMEIQLVKNETSADLQGVFAVPVYMSKGLEFEAVLICDADAENYYSEDDKKLLYIACTRALHRLNLFCQGEASPLL